MLWARAVRKCAFLLILAGCAGTEVQPLRRLAPSPAPRPREARDEEVDRWLNRSLRKELARGGATWYGAPGVTVPAASSDALLWHVPFDQRYDSAGGSSADLLSVAVGMALLLSRPHELLDCTPRGRPPRAFKDMDLDEYTEMLRNLERRR